MLIRILVVLALLALIVWGVLKIWRDWRSEFKALDKARHDRDLRERARPDVITLKRDKDGKFRPPEE